MGRLTELTYDTMTDAQRRVHDEIASGGMAKVHLGRVSGALGFSKIVAIKRILPHLLGQQEFVEMFIDETRVAARIQHPNVVSTLDAVTGLANERWLRELVGRDRVRAERAGVPLSVASFRLVGIAGIALAASLWLPWWRTAGGRGCTWSGRMFAPPDRPEAPGMPASSLPSRDAKIAPKIATPSEPPIERKNVAVEVATPMLRAGASFWTASTITCMTRPMPMPTTSMLYLVRQPHAATNMTAIAPATVTRSPRFSGSFSSRFSSSRSFVTMGLKTPAL